MTRSKTHKEYPNKMCVLYVHCVEGQHELTTDYDIREWMEGARGGLPSSSVIRCHFVML